jgi:hypothetical protein
MAAAVHAFRTGGRAIIVLKASRKAGMQYFVRTVERKRDNARRFAQPTPPPNIYPVVSFAGLGEAMGEAKRMVMESDRSIMLQSEACFINGNKVRTKYRCWIDERGSFNECALA